MPVFYEFGSLEAVTPEHFTKHFNVNVLGLLLATQEAAKRFGEAGGSVINISSIVSTIAPPGSVVYNATKGAVDTITRSLAHELGAKKIRVNAINPGFVRTEGTSGFMDNFAKGYIAQAPLGRIGEPQDIAGAAVYFASDESSWLTGQTLLISGGVQ